MEFFFITIIVVSAVVTAWVYRDKLIGWLQRGADQLDDAIQEINDEVDEIEEKIEDVTDSFNNVIDEVKKLQSMTKAQLEEIGRTVGIELDRRKTKENMIKDLKEHADKQ